MFPCFGEGENLTQCFPRIRGDVPQAAWRVCLHMQFSPHTRGCSAHGHQRPVVILVFPAYAGMFRHVDSGEPIVWGFPRIRGDVPDFFPTLVEHGEFSPHTRGCSIRRAFHYVAGGVFPAYAGMFRSTCSTLMVPRSFPRIRGDVPVHNQGVGHEIGFSPHTRGCSGFQGPSGW